MQRDLLLECVLFKARAQTNRFVGDSQVNLTSTKKTLTQEHELVKNLTKE